MMKSSILAALIVSLAACSGGGKGEATGPKNQPAGDDLDVGKSSGPTDVAGDAGAPPASAADAGSPAGASEPPGTGALVTFRLRNTHPKDDLVFSTDKGWQPILFGFSGKPPKAKGVMFFPMHCTASCDTPAEARCPHCPKPKKNKDEKQLEKREVVPAGKHIDVPWDGQIYGYSKTRAKGSACSCWKKEPVPTESYTIRACGFRLTEKADKRSKYECRDAKVSLPPDKPTVVEIEFKG